MKIASVFSSFVVLTFLSGVAVAADSECRLIKAKPDGSHPVVMTSCAIPGNADTDCVFPKIGVLEPVCAFRSWIIACGFSREASAKVANLLPGKGTKGMIGTLRVAKGFTASAATINAANLSLGFKEANGEPNYGLLCGPK